MNHTLGKINEQNSDAESYLEEIAHVIKGSTDKYFPTKQVKRHGPKKSWITNRIKRHIATRVKHYHLWLKKSSVDCEKYRKKRNEVNMEIKNAKRNEVQSRIDHNNSRELFRYIKKVKGTLNQVAKCDLSAEDFINYFKTAADTSDTILTHLFKSQQVEQPQSIFMRPVSEDEVSKHISTLKNKKFVGMDCIEVAVLKKAS